MKKDRWLIFFHTTLAVVIVIESANTLWDALSAHKFGAFSFHAALIAGFELVGAALFFFSKTLRIGGTILLLVFVVVFVIHGFRNELPLLVYGAGVIFIMAHPD